MAALLTAEAAALLLAASTAAAGAAAAVPAAGQGAHTAPQPAMRYTLSGSTGGRNLLVLRRRGAELELLDGITGRLLRRRALALTPAVLVNGANGHIDNTLTVDLGGGPIALPGGLRYDGGHGGFNTLTITGGRVGRERSVPSGPHSGLLGLDGIVIHYADIAPINDTTPAVSYEFNAGPTKQINIVNGPIVSGFQTTQIDSGPAKTFELVDIANKAVVTVNDNGGSDAITLNNPAVGAGTKEITVNTSLATTGPVTVLASAVPTNIVGGISGSVVIGAGSTQSILAPVTVENPPAFTNLTVDDSSDAVPRIVTISPAAAGKVAIEGLAPASITAVMNDLSALAVSGGTGGNLFTLLGTGASINGTLPFTLNSGTGNDVVDVRATSFVAPFGAPVTIHGQGGTDAVVVGDASGVQDIGAPVSVDNAAGYTALTVDDSLDPTGRAVTLAAAKSASVTGLAPAAVSANAGDLSGLTVDGGPGGNIFSVTGTPSGVTTTLSGGPSTPAFPGNVLNMALAGTTGATLAATPGAHGYQGSWSFAGRAGVAFSGFESFNPTVASVSSAAGAEPLSGVAPITFAATLLAPASQPVTVGYATADGSATAAGGDYQAASGTLTFAPGVTTKPFTVGVAADAPSPTPTVGFLVNLSAIANVLLAGGQAAGTITDRGFAGLAVATQSVKVKRGVATIAGLCPAGTTGGCSGVLGLATASPVGRAHHRRVLALGSAKFSLPAGALGRIKVHLSAAGLRQLRSSHSLKSLATAITHDGPGTKRITTASVKLH